VVVTVSEGVRVSKADRTRTRILDAAAEVFLARGYGGAGLRDIAAAAQMQVGSLYYHFASRDELVTEVLRVGQDLISRAVTERLAGLPAAATDLDRLRAVMRAHVESLAAHGNYTAAAMRLLGTVPPELHRQQLKATRSYGDLWRDLISAAQSSGVARPDLDPGATRMLVIGALNSIPDWHQLDRQTLTGDRLAHEFTTVFLDGLATSHRPHRHVDVPYLDEPRRTSKSPTRGASTRSRILASGADAFRERGFSDTAFIDVAEAAGLQRGSLYYHFTSRDELAEQLLRDAWTRTASLVRRAVDRLPDNASQVGRLETAITAHLLSQLSETGYTAGLVHVLARVPQDVRRQSLRAERSYMNYWRRLVADAIAAGDVHSGLHARTTVLILISALNWSIEWFEPSGALTPEQLADQMLTLVLDGLGTGGGDSGSPCRSEA
jgi:AcrR family transcriptional regulator